MSLMKFVSGKSSEKISVTILEPTADKQGYPVIIEENFQGKPLPVKFGRAFLSGKEGEKFFTLTGPIRKLDERDIPLTGAKMKDGEYVTEFGKITNEGLAARVNIYMKNSNTDQLVFSDLGTINIENTKKDNTPTKFTLASIKLFNDKEALEIAKLNYHLSENNKALRSNEIQNKPEIESNIELLISEIKQLQKNSGIKQTMFINDRTGYLESLGFEVRKKNNELNNESGMEC